jgi:Zinc finger, C3HC4 type (RING finger)
MQRNNHNHNHNDDTTTVEREKLLREKLQKVSDEIMTRFLRRSFVQALKLEEIDTALYCYIATSTDFEQHFLHLLQQQQLKGGSRKHPPYMKDETQQVPPVQQQVLEPTTTCSATSVTTLSPQVEAHGILQRSMNVCESFVMDDYHDPYHDSYEEDTDDEDRRDAIYDIIALLFHCDVNGTTVPSTSPSKVTTRSSCNTKRKHQQSVHFNRSSTPLELMMQRHTTKIPVDAPQDAHKVTTPIHEAARLGHVELLLRMLHRHDHTCWKPYDRDDLDVRNGYGRTVLHNVAGGMISHCERYSSTSTSTGDVGGGVEKIGIFALCTPLVGDVDKGSNDQDFPRPSSSHNDSEQSLTQRMSKSIIRGASRMTNSSTRWLSFLHNRRSHNDTDGTNTIPLIGRYFTNYYGDAVPTSRIDRLEALQLLLSWKDYVPSTTSNVDTEVSTEDGDDTTSDVMDEPKSSPSGNNSGEGGWSNYDYGGVFANAVDTASTRTALHYAAELGRSDICEAILASSYGILLTIVDSAGRTPCELAALYNHTALAAYLEARSLLYVDPIGTLFLPTISFTELNRTDTENNQNNQLVTPYCCFETISLSTVEQRREKLLKNATEQITSYLSKYNQLEHSSEQESKPVSVDFLDTTYAGIFPPKDKNDRIGGDHGAMVQSNSFHEGHGEKLSSYYKWVISDLSAALGNGASTTSQDVSASKMKTLIPFNDAQVPIPRPIKNENDDIASGESKRMNTCRICCDDFKTDSGKWIQLTDCGHGFCSDCLVDYITEYAKASSTGYVIECPHHDCAQLISKKEILDVVLPSSDTNERLRRSAIDTFVVAAQDYTYCPFPGCSENNAIHVVYPKLADSSDHAAHRLLGAVCTNVQHIQSKRNDDDACDRCIEPLVVTYEGIPDPRHYDILDLVQPKLAHRFCFECGEKQIHWPVTCSNLQNWRLTIIEYVGEQNLSNTSDVSENFNDMAQNLWMKANTRPCPKVRCLLHVNEFLYASHI